MVLSRYLVGICSLVLVLLSFLLPRPSNARSPLQEDGSDPVSTSRPPDRGTPEGSNVDWSNVELNGGRDSHLPQGAPSPPLATPSAPEPWRPEPGNAEPAPLQADPPPAVEPGPSGAISSDGGNTYVVRSGDTAYEIAGRYGVTVAALAAANNLTDPSMIYAGDVLVIPDTGATTPEPVLTSTPEAPAEGNIYTVRSGDSPYLIARRFGVPVQTLMDVNHITNPTRLSVGQRLIIPGMDVAAPPAPGEPQATVPAKSAADGDYVVRSGDTLYEIARRFGTSTSSLTSANKLANPHRLAVGQVLVIPDAEPESVSTPAPSPAATVPPPVPVVETPPPQETGFIWPVEGRAIAQYFRYGHRAIDIYLPIGTPIVATADGVVEFSGWNNYGLGWLTVVDHGNGFRTLYAHQSELLVRAGQEVTQGELIGRSGHTGWSTHPHLHFGILLNYAPQDPCTYLPGGC